jgi:hypothetical protein
MKSAVLMAMNVNNFVFFDATPCRLIEGIPGVSNDYGAFTLRVKQDCLSVISRRLDSSINNVFLTPGKFITVRVVTVITDK